MGQKQLEEFFTQALEKIDWRTHLRATAEDICKYRGAVTLPGPAPIRTMVVCDEEFAMKQFIRQLKGRKKKS